MPATEYYVHDIIDALQLPPILPAIDVYELEQDRRAEDAAISRINDSMNELKLSHQTTPLVDAVIGTLLTPSLGDFTSKIRVPGIKALIDILGDPDILSLNVEPGSELGSVTSIIYKKPDDVTTTYVLAANRVKETKTQDGLISTDTRYVYNRKGRVVKVDMERDGLPNESVELLMGHVKGDITKTICRRTNQSGRENHVIYFSIRSINPEVRDLEAELQAFDVPSGFGNQKYKTLIVTDIFAGSAKEFVEYEPESL